MAPRSRTLTGCGTCRKRHLKCDEGRPTCRSCQRLNLICQGYEAKLSWTETNDENENGPAREENLEITLCRRPLFSANEQQSMASDLANCLGDRSPGEILSQLDLDCQTLHFDDAGQNHFSSFIGPFGAFKLQVSSNEPCRETEQLAVDESLEEPCNEHLNEELIEFADETIFSELYDPSIGMGTIVEDNEFLQDFLVQDPSTHQESLSFDRHSCTEEIQSFSPLLNHGPSLSTFTFTHKPPITLPPDAQLLLSHYSTRVLPLLSLAKDKRNSPWHTIHLPCAMHTFADLSIGNASSHTRMTHFYAALATSCLHLAATEPENYSFRDWAQSGNHYYQLSKWHLREALGSEVSGPKKAKYKELLMAILRMVTIPNSGPTSSDTQAFFLDAERLIRIRGLPKTRKSIEVRSLHHVYTYLRIVAESTHALARPVHRPQISLQGSAAYDHQDIALRSFRIPDFLSDADLDMKLEKNVELGQNDVHLEVLGHWNETLYPDIYGIPEVLITLLSQTIRLINEQESFQAATSIDPLTLNNLARRAKLLEQHITSWKPVPGICKQQGSYNTKSPSGQTVMNYMVLSVHQALIIFFYKRVHKINATLLQNNVETALEYLQQAHEMILKQKGYGINIVWPAFIAACEALSTNLQDKALKLLSAMRLQTGLSNLNAATEIVREVWRSRSEDGNMNTSWPEVMKRKDWTIIPT